LQFWRVSRIHRNILKKRLEYLVKEGTILTHKFSIPYTREFYGYMYKYPVANPYTSPLHGCTYYLLNCSNPECSDLIDYYYDNKTTEKVDPAEKDSQKKGGRNRPELCMFQENIGEIAKEAEQYDYNRLTKINAEEFNKVWRMMIEQFIYHSRLWQEFMIDAAKRGQRLYSRSEEEEISEIKERHKTSSRFFYKKRLFKTGCFNQVFYRLYCDIYY
jgi:hypothetical protein